MLLQVSNVLSPPLLLPHPEFCVQELLIAFLWVEIVGIYELSELYQVGAFSK